MKSLTWFIAVFGAIGIAVATTINAFWSIFERALPSYYYLPVFKATLVLFPAFIGTMAISGASYWSAASFGLIALNGVIYAAVGLMTWLGLRKSRLIFVLESVLFVAFLGVI